MAGGKPKKQRSRQKTPLDWLEEQLANRPTDAGLWYGKGVLLVKDGELESALKCFDNVLWVDPGHIKALEAKAKALFRLDKFLEAYDAFRKLTRKIPRDEEYWYFCGECLKMMGNPGKALSFYDKALEIDPNYSDAWYGRGEALKGSQSAHGYTGETAESEEEALEEVKDSAIEELLARAETSMYAEDYEEALGIYNSVIEMNQGEARAWEGKGTVLTRLSRFSEAAECYERAIAARPGTPPKELEKARALKDEGRTEEALRTFGEALQAYKPESGAGEAKDHIEVERAPETAAPPSPPPTTTSPLTTGAYATYLQLLDNAMGGGITPGSVILVSGMPGTLKTSLCFWILFKQAVQEGRRGLYVTLEQPKAVLLRHVASLGLDPTIAAGTLRILDMSKHRKRLRPKESPQRWLDILKQKIEEVSREGVEALVIDSLDALACLATFKDRRRDTLQLFEFLRNLGVTSFVVTERYELEYEGELVRAYDVQDYLSDGIFALSFVEREGNEPQRAIRVEKMRDRLHPAAIHALLWDGGFKLARLLSGSSRAA